jgi:hypothetical protein
MYILLSGMCLLQELIFCSAGDMWGDAERFRKAITRRLRSEPESLYSI